MKHGFARTLPLLFLAVVTGLVSCKNITSKNSTLPTDLVKELADEKITRNIPSDCTIQEYSAEELFDKSKSGIAVVLTDSGVGSAFVVKHEDNSTLLVTNAHVVQGNRVVTLKWSDDSQDQAAVVKLGNVQSLLLDGARPRRTATFGAEHGWALSPMPTAVPEAPPLRPHHTPL